MEPTDTEILDWIERNPDVVIKASGGRMTASQPCWHVDPERSMAKGVSRDLRAAIKEAMRHRP
jgi:hypothetical protein